MNIELIKTEIAKLSQIVTSWSDESSISAIEKELLLSKLQSLYEIIRFDTAPTIPSKNIATIATATVAEAVNRANADYKSDEGDEPEVEVEFLFDEEEPSVTLFSEEVEQDEESDETDEAEEADAPTEAIEEPEPEPETTPEPEPAKEEEEKTEPLPQMMGNLFGIEEPKRHTRSKHLRMMSLYDDADETTPKEKSVDVSKIFDLGIDDIEPMSKEEISDEAVLAESSTPTTIADASEHSVTLADTIAPNQPTLADTISRPAPLADEITNSKISSLHDGVGINDKFLMIRDLFDGDEEAYEQALQDLDAQESFDDCMIYIVENFAWNPDSEGAKFIMKLLERKHS